MVLSTNGSLLHGQKLMKQIESCFFKLTIELTAGK